ncbi:MAG: VOC family protein [marine benthic group bacterium]|nr:VOC family protein [Gemmatimonadota bacterium]
MRSQFDRIVRRGSLVGLVAASLITTSCSTGSPEQVRPPVPAIAPGLNPEYRTGSFVWHDLLVRDPGTVRNFYASLFGWSFREVDGSGRYLAIELGDRAVGGLAVVSDTASDSFRGVWLSSVSVDDVDRATTRVTANGGTVMLPPEDLPSRGRHSVIADPQGAALVLLRSSTGDGPRPAEGTIGNGEWLWTELWTDDTSGARRFYSALLGYGFEPRESRSSEVNGIDAATAAADEAGYHLFTRSGEPLAGMARLPFTEARPHWLPFVAVGDVAEATRKVASLGGTIIIAPEDVERKDAAIVADPSGAVFGLQQWPRPSQAGGGR